MKKSSSRRRNRSRSPDDSKSKRTRTRSKSHEREKVKSIPRKTRWEKDDKCKKDVKKQASSPDPVPKKEKPGLPRIRDCLQDKEKIVNLLFQTVTGAALQDLIPDYLKKRSTDELKKLCLEQIEKMSDEAILQIISGKVDSSNKEGKAVEKEKILKPEQPSSPKKNEVKEMKTVPEKKAEVSKVAKSLSDVSHPQEVKLPVKDEMIPLVIKDEVAKDLILPERDAELLELEMRARAIRSLLKAKSHSTNEDKAKGDK